MKGVCKIPPTVISSYIEKFNPHLPRKDVERRLEFAVRRILCNRSLEDGISYVPEKVVNGHDGICYFAFHDGEVVGVLTKQEYGQTHRTQ